MIISPEIQIKSEISVYAAVSGKLPGDEKYKDLPLCMT